MNLEIGQNIIPSINYIITAMPDDITDIEKLRYIYINLGKLFSYDYRIIVDESVIKEPLNFSKEFITRYKTCYQISEILTILINGTIPGCKAKIIERTIPGRSFSKEHVAVEVTTKDGLKLLLDLTLDLAHIQGGLKTKEFAFTTNETSDYDIISLRECAEMDKKLGFIVDKYTDDYIAEFLETIKKTDFSRMSPPDIIAYKINKAKETLAKDFKGNHEAISYIYTVLCRILTDKELSSLKQYNLTYHNSDDFNILAIYAFLDYDLYYSFSNELGFNKISLEVLSNLLKRGWQTNSQSINSIFEEQKPEVNPNR